MQTITHLLEKLKSEDRLIANPTAQAKGLQNIFGNQRIGYRHNKIHILCRETEIGKKHSQNIFCFDVFCDFEFQNFVFGA